MNADTWPPAWWSDRSRELRAQLEQRSKQLEEIHPVNTRQGGVFDPAYARLAAELSASVSADFKVKEQARMSRVSDAEVKAALQAYWAEYWNHIGDAFQEALRGDMRRALEAAAEVREQAEPTCWFVLKDETESWDFADDESGALEAAEEGTYRHPGSTFSIVPLYAVPVPSEPMVPLSAVADLRDSLEDDRQFQDERSKHESVVPAERVWSTGAAAAFGSAVGYVDAAFPQLKEAS